MGFEPDHDRGDEFVALYNQLDAHLRRVTGADRHVSFMSVVRQAAKREAAVRAHLGKIHSYSQLRNAIVHDSDAQNGIIADPRPEALEDLRRVVEGITAPRSLLSIASREISVCRPDMSLASGLSQMRSGNFSQVVVQTGPGYGILSVEGVARWLGTQVDRDVVSVTEATIGDAIEQEPPSTAEFLDRASTVYDGYEVFQPDASRPRARVFAILITESGIRTERPIGIVTAWDLFRLHQQPD